MKTYDVMRADSVMRAVYFDSTWGSLEEAQARVDSLTLTNLIDTFYIEESPVSEEGEISYFNKPTQVKFIDSETEEIHYGIGYDNLIICGCCGGTFEVDEIGIIKRYQNWVNFENYIRE